MSTRDVEGLLRRMHAAKDALLNWTLAQGFHRPHEPLDRVATELTAAGTMIRALRIENERLRKTFAHHHVATGAAMDDDIDTCQECGLDIRDPIHTRVHDGHGHSKCVHGASLDDDCWQCMEDPRAGNIGRRVK